ncbi:MAG: hypothetical protein HDS93_02950 [Bacteroidales bacterium]|nr:hypothetical protein [Bacteroidales bacterium]
MNKLLLFFTFLTPMVCMADYTPGYYDTMNGKSKEKLKEAAKSCVTDHRRLAYYDLPDYWQYTDVYPELYDGSRRWWDMYSNQIQLIRSNQSPRQSFSSNNMNREHSIPKSWWKKAGDVEYTPAYSDLWNLYPSDATANSAKLNYPFGPVRTPIFDNGSCKVGGAMSGFGGGSANVFEPADEYKGDFARSIFYMATVYDDLPWVYTYMFEPDSQWPTLRTWAYDMLLQWARRDPVSQKERDRNDAVEKQQGNRNPFIDFPELAEYIWGTRTMETFIISEQGNVVTPPITGDPEVTAPVTGEALDFGQAAVGMTVSASLRIKAQNLTSPLSLRVNGADKAMFVPEVKSISAGALNTVDDYLLTIAYTPTSLGQHTATLALYDGGLPGGQSISVTLIGEALPVPELSALTAYEPTELSGNHYVANWSKAPEVVDFYVVNRVRYVEDEITGELLQSAINSLAIDDRDPDIMESYTVMSVRLGCMSPSSNSIIVPTAASVKGVDDVLPVIISPDNDGFTIICDGETSGVEVFDLLGRKILSTGATTGNSHWTLPSGIYIISGSEMKRPVKIILN